ncbi:Nascent polypeptide-associated complex subunit beta [Ceratobasidium sp. 395]|nr:Nascent polypeptide-associated complex subunit beta [Ceratobasidium sp. 395]
MNAEKLAKLQAAAAANRIGGKGTVRRKVVPRSSAKASGGDDKKLAAALKKLGVQPVAGIDEVNMFQADGNVLHFAQPKGTHIFSPVLPTVHAASGSNTTAIFGTGQVKELTELVPGILNQLGPDSLASLRKLAESYQLMQARAQAAQAQGGGGPPADDDDEVPDLIENFDAVAVEDEKKEKEKAEDAETKVNEVD